MFKVVIGNICLLFVAMLAGCYSKPPAPVEYQVVSEPAPVPPGVVQYCWEEPQVQEVDQRPGVNVEQTWYHPSYTAVRQVRGGKWRPCQPIKREVVGEFEGYGKKEDR